MAPKLELGTVPVDQIVGSSQLPEVTVLATCPKEIVIPAKQNNRQAAKSGLKIVILWFSWRYKNGVNPQIIVFAVAKKGMHAGAGENLKEIQFAFEVRVMSFLSIIPCY